MRTYLILFLLPVALLGCKKKEAAGMVSDHFYLQNNNATMPVYVEGNMSSNKILVMIHGGPGDGSLYFNTAEATAIAEQEFAVAYWDQRASGSSQGNFMSVDLHNYTDDLKKLIYLLRYRYGESKQIYLLGHSWGGLIAPLFLQEGNNQQLVQGWIQVDGAHNYELNDSLSRASLLAFGQQEINAGRNTGKWQEIVNYCAGHDPEDDYDVARKINSYANSTDEYISDVYKGSSTGSNINYFIREYRYPISTFLSNGIYNHFVEELEEDAYDVNVSSRLSLIQIPTLLLWGKYDFVCPVGLRDEIAGTISSTDITSVVFNNSGHSPMRNEPTAFWQTVTGWVKTH